MKMILTTVLIAALLCGTATAAARLPTLRMLSTTTCPACAMMSKVLDEINAKYKGKLFAEKVLLEDHPDVAKQYNVRYVPMLIFLDGNGQEIAQGVGYKSLDDVLQIFASKGIKIQ